MNQNNQDLLKLISKTNYNRKDEIFDSNNNVNIEKIIKEALDIDSAKKTSFENNLLKKDELLEKTKENSIMNFLSDLQNKNINQIKNSFLSKIKDNSANAQVQIENSKNQAKDYIAKYNNIFEENKKVNQEILEMNNKYRELGFELKKSQNTISQMQINDENLKHYKLLYDEFLLQYPDIDPITQMKEIQKNKINFFNKFNEYNDLQRKFEIDKKEYQQRLKQGKKVLNNLQEKFNRIDESNKLKKKENKLIINELKLEKETLQKLKEDNNKYRKMLFNLFLKLMEAFKLNKKINIDKKYLQIKENEFYPDLLDDLEIWEYIKAMINNINPSINDQSLKETIAYSNMITRIYLKNKNSLRYDPLNTFKELKSIMEEKEQKICKLSDNVKDFEIKLNTMELENKKLNNLFIHFNQERNKNLSNKSVLNHQTPNTKRTTSAFNIRSNNFSSKNKIQNRSISTKSFISKNKRPFSSMNLYKITKNKGEKYMNRKYSNKSVEDEQVETDILTKNNKYLKDSNLDKKKKYSRISISYSKNNYLNNEEMKDFKKIKESKNKDKILKIHNQQPLVKCINEFNQLINHTNRLFVYKTKIAPKDNKNKNLPRLTKKNIKNKEIKKSKSVEELKVGKNKVIKEKEFSFYIVNRLNRLIRDLESQKFKAKKNIDIGFLKNVNIDKI